MLIAEAMQKYCEAPTMCLPNKVYPYGLQCNGSFVEGFAEPKDELSSNSGGGVVEPDNSFTSMPFAPPDESYYGQLHQQDYYVWSGFHPDIQKAQHNHYYALESHFYPMNHEHYFPGENQFQYVPLRMMQGYPHDFQFQEFQYFVVIDFEATCDKERYPHPQEIIEFPSVVVNSATGQIEDFFQIYVRPTYNQHLSDFCKELTGIQQAQVLGRLPSTFFQLIIKAK